MKPPSWTKGRNHVFPLVGGLKHVSTKTLTTRTPLVLTYVAISSAVASKPDSGNVGVLEDYPVYENRDTFYAALAEFTAEESNARFLSDIVYKESGDIEVGRWISLYTLEI